jgi:hypothetical protein
LGSGGVFPLLSSPSLVFTSDADHIMAYPEVSGSSGVLVVTSSVSLTATRNLVAPLTKGFQWTVKNATTGGQSIKIVGSSGTGVTIANGSTALVFCDGANYVSIGGTVYPPSGVPNSTGSGYGSSYAVGTGANNLVQLNSSSALPAVNGGNLTSLNGANLQSGTVANAALANNSISINSTPCVLGGSCTVAGGSGLGGTLSNSNIAAGTSVTATIAGLDGSHEVQFSTSAAIAGGSDLFTVTFTASRGHTSFCVYSHAIGGSLSSLTTIGQLPVIFGTATNYTLTAGPDGLPSGATFEINVSCP